MYELYCRSEGDIEVQVGRNQVPKTEIIKKVLEYTEYNIVKTQSNTSFKYTYTFDYIKTLVEEAKSINERNSNLQNYLKTKNVPQDDELIKYINKQKYDKIIVLANIRNDAALSQRVGAYRTLEYVSEIKST
jgi:hypothetical protein